jgi:sec-independent protein translocase protein TatA
MPSLGGWEFVILIAVLVLVFGAKKLPDMARSIGQSARVFKGEMKGMKRDDDGAGPATPPAPPAQAPQVAPPVLPVSQQPLQDPTRTAQPGRDDTAR